jgi:nitroimidazol reductase NimA-like FMN-containing flavoprotein (pyridoxamine 5'-phosphate oxidase superfamily)
MQRVTSRPGALAIEPPRERPDSPPASYGVPQTGGDFVAWHDAIERLRNATGYWLATVTPGGRPHVVPIWGVLVDDDLYLETGAPETRKNHNLAANPQVLVHLDGVDDAVIIRGQARPVAPDAELGTALAAAFHAKYPDYSPGPTDWNDGGLIRIEPTTLLAWRDMPTATRWRFSGLAEQQESPS